MSTVDRRDVRSITAYENCLFRDEVKRLEDLFGVPVKYVDASGEGCENTVKISFTSQGEAVKKKIDTELGKELSITYVVPSFAFVFPNGGRIEEKYSTRLTLHLER